MNPTTTADNSSVVETSVGPKERLLSVIAGGALTTYGLKRKDLPGALMVATGGLLLWRGGTGHHIRQEMAGLMPSRPVHATEVVTIRKPVEELYAFWRNFENLPKIMYNLESVRVLDGGRSVWKAKGPAKSMIEWEAITTADVPNERIAWRSTGEAYMPHSGVVTFRKAPGEHGSEVQVDIEYTPPAGKAGQMIASMLGSAPEQEIREDMRRFKQLMETGEISTTEGQPAAHRHSMFGFLSHSAK